MTSYPPLNISPPNHLNLYPQLPIQLLRGRAPCSYFFIISPPHSKNLFIPLANSPSPPYSYIILYCNRYISNSKCFKRERQENCKPPPQPPSPTKKSTDSTKNNNWKSNKPSISLIPIKPSKSHIINSKSSSGPSALTSKNLKSLSLPSYMMFRKLAKSLSTITATS